MPVQRVEWRCPECGKRYAIPADMPTPDLCPQCREESEQPGAPSAEFERPVVSGGGTPVGVPEPSEPAEQPVAVRTRTRRYADLRIISTLLKVLAGLAGAGGLITLIWAGIQALTAEAGAERSASIYFGLGAFASSLLAALCLWTAGGLICVLLDIEQNTRRR